MKVMSKKTTHKDSLGRTIYSNDIVVWSNGKHGQKMEICKVSGESLSKVYITKPDGNPCLVLPTNLVVITHQIAQNELDNFGEK